VQEQIDKDLKEALLGGDKAKAETLRGLKNALQYEAKNSGSDTVLSDEQIQKVLAKESKKRTEAAELYKKGGNNDRAEAELAEKTVIDSYLPDQVDEAAIEAAVKAEIDAQGAASMADMGKVIGAVRTRLGAGADGALIAKITKEKLSQ
jgi:uncharacterized protein YqeY